MTDRAETDARVKALIEPFNKKGIAVDDADALRPGPRVGQPDRARFRRHIEDEFDILITMNQQAEIETVGQLVDAVEKLEADK